MSDATLGSDALAPRERVNIPIRVALLRGPPIKIVRRKRGGDCD